MRSGRPLRVLDCAHAAVAQAPLAKHATKAMNKNLRVLNMRRIILAAVERLGQECPLLIRQRADG